MRQAGSRSRVRRPSIRGARAANAGDDYHELWAIREALSLLDPASALRAITLEGLHPHEEAASPQAAWEGVDCAYYFGGEDLQSAVEVAFDQVKYSTTEPTHAWTVARLTKRARRTVASSVMGRLGAAFTEYHRLRPDLVQAGRLGIRLVSNQPIGQEVLDALRASGRGNAPASRNRRRLATASTVARGFQAAFFESLDFSQCGAGSRLSIETALVRTLSAWTHPNALAASDMLRRKVRELMMPEGVGRRITRREVLSWFGFASDKALFPCPSAVDAPRHIVQRNATEKLLELLRSATQRICVHGGGGVGKTTVLVELAQKLPAGSVMVDFDCYGGGRYLDAESPRHRPAEAFLQIANELAARMKLPPLLDRSPDATGFADRLQQAAQALAVEHPDAWLVLAIDAADNAVHAAHRAAPPEPAFVHALVRLGALPGNVRLVISTRTSRMDSIDLGRRFQLVEVGPFAPDETAAFVRFRLPTASQAWLEDFHSLSGGNPRVQSYAFATSEGDSATVLAALRPSGRTLEQVFDGQLREALLRAGLATTQATTVARGLLALPRPVPLRHLGPVVGLSEVHLRELAIDLAPGIRLADDALGFADEDFESFMRGIAGDLAPVVGAVADRLTATQEGDEYAAVHIAPALLAAGRRRELLELVRREGPPAIIQDPVIRRHVQLQRMRIAVRVCREAGDVADALLTSVRGAAALKTDTAIRDALRRFPDLAVRFAGRSVEQMFLRDADELEHHGTLLFHRLASDAERGDGVAVREGWRWLGAWLNHWAVATSAARRAAERADEWDLDPDAVAAETISLIRIVGAKRAWRRLRDWRPAEFRFRALLSAVHSLVARGDIGLLESALSKSPPPVVDFGIRVALAMRSGTMDSAPVERTLTRMLDHGKIPNDERTVFGAQPSGFFSIDEAVLTGCELCIASGSRTPALLEILRRFGVPGQDRAVSDHHVRIDLRLRALAMLARLDGTRLDVLSLLSPKPTTQRDSVESRREAKRWEDHHRELDDLVSPLLGLYDTRARCLLSAVPKAELEALLKSALKSLEDGEYRMIHRIGGSALRIRSSSALLTLLGRDGVDSRLIWGVADQIANTKRLEFDADDVERWLTAAARPELHELLLARATEIVTRVQQAQMPAKEQVDALCYIARALLPISPDDASAIFLKALDAAAGVDEDVMHLLPRLGDFAARGVATVDFGLRRALARDTAIVLEDAATRLRGYDGFPWRSGAATLARWDLSFALAAACRWEDEAVVSRSDLLSTILLVAVGSEQLSPQVALSLMVLLEYSEEPHLLEVIADAGQAADAVTRDAMAEHIAQDELRYGTEGQGRHGEGVLRIASELRATNMPGPHERELAAHVAFHAGLPHNEERAQHHAWIDEDDAHLPSADDLIQRYPWSGCDLSRPDAVAAAITELTRPAAKRPYIPVSAVLAHIRTLVPLQGRRAHLEVVVGLLRTPGLLSTETAGSLIEALDEWQGQPSVHDWIVSSLLDQLPEILPAFLMWGGYQASALTSVTHRIVEVGGEDFRDRVLDALLRALELHVESLDATDIYALVGRLAEFVDERTAGRVATGLTESLLQRVDPRHRSNWDIADLPAHNVASVGRALFALLGDMDSRIRWRAAHAVRRLAASGQQAFVDAVVAQYDRTDDRVFRDPEAPFYWQAARLWLAIALCRVAHERPEALTHQVTFLVRAGTERAFPHLLLRHFVANAVRTLDQAGVARLTEADRTTLAEGLGAGRPRSRVERESRRMMSARDEREESSKARFQYDSIDTIPYWYQPATTVFTDVSLSTFLSHTDRWIVDKWGGTPELGYWNSEPRQHRLSERDWGMWSHSHGSLPVLDRISTHWEWHAMSCAMGELVEHSTLRGTDDRYGDRSIEGWLADHSLSEPPMWLADTRGPRPMHPPLFVSHANEGWEEAVTDSDFLAEAGLEPGEPTVVLAATWSFDHRPVRVSTEVHCAFVTPKRALALLRALQTVDSAYDFRLPDAGDDMEIRTPGRQLLGILERRERESGIDKYDPLRRGAPGLGAMFPPEVAASLGLRFVLQPKPGWEETESGTLVLRYESWGERDPRRRYDQDEQGGSGWRLLIDRHFLGRIMARRKMDLLVSIEIERRLHRYRSDDSDSQGEAPPYHSRLYLLRRSGELLAAERPIGTWSAPSP